MPSLKEIRAKLQALENRSNNSNRDESIYPFWNIQDGNSAKIRFLPDANPDNPFFWKERQQIRIPFAGIKGEDENKKITIVVPCVEMWGETCPIHTEIRPWFKDPALEDTARTYWKKRSFMFQGFVQENSVADDLTPDNPIRRFVIGNQIFKIIKASLLDPDFEYLPTDYVNGTDFIISKTTKGGYADYSTSKWARRENALDQDQLENIETHGLSDLSEFLPKRPTPEQLNAMYEMFEASVDGDLYDPARWAQYYKPFGYEYNGVSNTAESVQSKAPETTVDSKLAATQKELQESESDPADPPAKTPSNSGTAGKSAQEILDMIRDRNKD